MISHIKITQMEPAKSTKITIKIKIWKQPINLIEESDTPGELEGT